MTGPFRHTFADNQSVRVGEALRAFAAYDGNRWPISIATGYFDLAGFAVVADMLEAAPSVKILIGAEPEQLIVPDQLNLEREDKERQLQRLQEALVAGRNTVSFGRSQDALLERLFAFLERATTQVRIFRERFLHGKAFIFGEEAGVLAGSANFTGAGLTRNLELDVGDYNPDHVRAIARWFDDLWSRSGPYDLAEMFRARLELYDPYKIYLRMLLAQYHEDLEANNEATGSLGALRLAEFQKLGSQRAIRILDKWGGALLADGVGLGKTIIAGEIIRTFVVARGLHVLIVAPAALRPMWQQFLEREMLPGAVVSFNELARDRRLSVDGLGDALRLPPDQYRLVVIDEAHALRNPETQAYHAMVRLLALSDQAKVLLLTATPVNNSLWDLYNELMLFAKTDSRFATLGVANFREHVKRVMRVAVDELDPGHLFSILDEVAVRRTRLFIKENFPNEEVAGPHGPVRIVFPEVSVVPLRYDLDRLSPGLFGRVVDAIESRLTMARYRVQAYTRRPVPNVARQEVLAGLLRSQMLKRFESSVEAFRLTTQRMVDANVRALSLIEERGVVPLASVDPEIDIEDRDVMEILVAEGVVDDAADYDVEGLVQALRNDISVLTELGVELQAINRDEDPKLAALLTVLHEAAKQPRGDKRKLLVFTYYADTVQYIRDYLIGRAQDDVGLADLVSRAAFVAGNEHTDPDERARYAAEFAPQSMRPGDDTAMDSYDLLVTTDVLAEGQNLQQCGRLVNFDLPWNPMRIVQRNGRIDRIGSPHDTVMVYCIMPDRQLERVLMLEDRLRRKIAQANAAVGTEGTILPGVIGVERTFTDELREEEQQILRLAEGDSSVIDELEREGENAFSGESFREELRQTLLAEGSAELEALPWAIGSGHDQGRVSAIVFLARAGGRYFFRLVKVDGATFRAEDDLLGSLQAARCSFDAPRVYSDLMRPVVYDAWETVRSDLAAWFDEQRDPRSRQSAIPRVQREAIELLQRAGSAEAAMVAETLGAQWPSDVQKALRAIVADGGPSDRALVDRIIAFARARGLKPVPVEPASDARRDDIHLICYQIVTS